MVRVLILVDEDIAERLAPALARLGKALEHVDGEHEQVVEVDGVGGVQASLVEQVHVGDGLVEERRDALVELLRPDEVVLLARDHGVDTAWREAFRVAVELLEALLDEAHLVGLVVDREVRAVTEALGLAAEDAAARGVEREDPDRAGDRPEHAAQDGRASPPPPCS